MNNGDKSIPFWQSSRTGISPVSEYRISGCTKWYCDRLPEDSINLKSSCIMGFDYSCGTEREGFEPSLKSPLNSISSAAPSTARPSLQGVIQCGKSYIHHAISDYTLKV